MIIVTIPVIILNGILNKLKEILAEVKAYIATPMLARILENNNYTESVLKYMITLMLLIMLHPKLNHA